MRALRQRGSNRFDVHRLGASGSPRFPVFLRRANDHRGPRTSLLASPAELEAEIASWRRSGEDLGDVIATEYCDTADENGVYRKYGAFLLAGRILPRHLFFSDHWNVKAWRLAGDGFLSEEIRFLETNPHRGELSEIFALARRLRRIAYSVTDGCSQVWEIHTNPMIVRPSPRQRPLRGTPVFDEPGGLWRESPRPSRRMARALKNGVETAGRNARTP